MLILIQKAGETMRKIKPRKIFSCWNFFFLKSTAIVFLTFILTKVVDSNSKLDVAIFVLGLGISVLLIDFELRESRRLDVYHKTFEELIYIFEDLDNLFNEIVYPLISLYQINQELIDQGGDNNILLRPAGENINVLDYSISTRDFIDKKLNEINQITFKIEYLSMNFNENSDSRKLLMEIKNKVEDFIDLHYADLKEALDKIKKDRVIFPEELNSLFPSTTLKADGVDHPCFDASQLKFYLLNKNKIMEHFNKNNFR